MNEYGVRNEEEMWKNVEVPFGINLGGEVRKADLPAFLSMISEENLADYLSVDELEDYGLNGTEEMNDGYVYVESSGDVSLSVEVEWHSWEQPFSPSEIAAYEPLHTIESDADSVADELEKQLRDLICNGKIHCRNAFVNVYPPDEGMVEHRADWY